MIVVDACALIEVLLRSELGHRIEERLLSGGELLNVPHLLDVEVLQVFRSLVSAKELNADRAAEKIERLRDMDLIRHAHDELIPRMFNLRHNLTAYDAAYLALAEHLQATLITSDRVFAKVPGGKALVEIWK